MYNCAKGHPRLVQTEEGEGPKLRVKGFTVTFILVSENIMYSYDFEHDNTGGLEVFECLKDRDEATFTRNNKYSSQSDLH
ncbi:15038_t:CDS:2 [Funneliformis mosseae]|uniref:15038_t:CDS:1 n=1 Tax=Funneliformis mosseae TaxID=27381 RepID=A0A9N9DKN6_FUNMO|nr:15038_t:CDS:2 [Funneliformis mosseae]